MFLKRFLPLALILLPLMFFLLATSDPQVTRADKQPASPPVNGQSSAQKEAIQPFFKTISPAEANELIKNRKDLQVIDVRTPQERKQFRIADTRLVPVGDVMRGVFNGDPDKPVMLICAVGGRSYIAGKVMYARGYRQVYNLEGGIESWRRAGLPVETDPEDQIQ